MIRAIAVRLLEAAGRFFGMPTRAELAEAQRLSALRVAFWRILYDFGLEPTSVAPWLAARVRDGADEERAMREIVRLLFTRGSRQCAATQILELGTVLSCQLPFCHPPSHANVAADPDRPWSAGAPGRALDRRTAWRQTEPRDRELLLLPPQEEIDPILPRKPDREEGP